MDMTPTVLNVERFSMVFCFVIMFLDAIHVELKWIWGVVSNSGPTRAVTKSIVCKQHIHHLPRSRVHHQCLQRRSPL